MQPFLFPAPNEMAAYQMDEEERNSHFPPPQPIHERDESRSQSTGSDADAEKADETPALPPLTKRQITTICMLALANFASTVVFSCIAPFFPAEAKAKGASATVIGFIFSSFELVMFFAAPFYGRYVNFPLSPSSSNTINTRPSLQMDTIGPKLCYCGG